MFRAHAKHLPKKCGNFFALRFVLCRRFRNVLLMIAVSLAGCCVTTEIDFALIICRICLLLGAHTFCAAAWVALLSELFPVNTLFVRALLHRCVHLVCRPFSVNCLIFCSSASPLQMLDVFCLKLLRQNHRLWLDLVARVHTLHWSELL